MILRYFFYKKVTKKRLRKTTVLRWEKLELKTSMQPKATYDLLFSAFSLIKKQSDSRRKKKIVIIFIRTIRELSLQYLENLITGAEGLNHIVFDSSAPNRFKN